MVFKALPAGVSRNVDGSVLPLVSGDGTVVGFSSSQGDTFMPALATDPLTGKMTGLAGPDGINQLGIAPNVSTIGGIELDIPTIPDLSALRVPAVQMFAVDAKGRKSAFNGNYNIFSLSDGWQRVCDGATDTQKVSLLDILIPGGTLRDGSTLVITHYWQFPTGDKTTTGTGTKNLLLTLDDSVNSTSAFYAASVNAGKAFDGETEIRIVGATLFVPNQLKATGQVTSAPVSLTSKDLERDHYLKFYGYWTSNQTADSDSICLSSVKVQVNT